MAHVHVPILLKLTLAQVLFWQGAVAFRVRGKHIESSELQSITKPQEEEHFPGGKKLRRTLPKLFFQADLSPLKTSREAFPRFKDCEYIGIVMEGDANRPDMRAEALIWVDFLQEQGYCVAYFIDWTRHASQAWKQKDVTMNFGFTWKDALKEVDQSDDGQVIQMINSTKENWAAFTGGLGKLCASKSCRAKRVVMAFEDHGEYRILGLPDHKKLSREDLLGGLRSLYRLNRDVKLLAYVSACKSGSMFGGPQYTAKELLQYHYFDCEIRDDSCADGPMTNDVTVVAGHSIVGVRQRAWLRATEAVLEAQAMCDLAAGDVQGEALIYGHFQEQGLSDREAQRAMAALLAGLEAKNSSELSEEEAAIFAAMSKNIKPRKIGKWARKVNDSFKKLKDLSISFDKWKDLAVFMRFYLMENETLNTVMASASALKLNKIVQTHLDVEMVDSDEDDTAINITADVEEIRIIDPTFDLTYILPGKEPDLRESSFIKAFNKKVLKAWFNVRSLVNEWKAAKNGRPLWEELTNGPTFDAQVASEAQYEVPWGLNCGTLSACLETFGRAQVLSKLHDKELGCGGKLEARWEGHILASGQDASEGIEENGGLSESAMPHILKHLLRAISYSTDKGLVEWDTDLKTTRKKLTTGDLDYAEDAMMGAALTNNEPIDLMAHLDGDRTRPESVLAFSASVPQIISSSLLPFTVQSIADLRSRIKPKRASVDTTFRAHARSVEDQTINQDSMHTDMMFGMTNVFMRTMLWLNGREDATISITGKGAAKRAEELERLAETSAFFKKSKERKAVFYEGISKGELPEGFLSFSYVSPATNRTIIRYFDTTLSSENFGSPIVFGNMLNTSLTEFFKHVPSTKERISKRLAGMTDDMKSFFKGGGDWFKKVSEPKKVFSSEDKRCCCKSDLECELLVADELRKIRNPWKWTHKALKRRRNAFKTGSSACPEDLGYKHYTRFNLTEPPASCRSNRRTSKIRRRRAKQHRGRSGTHGTGNRRK